MINAVQRHFGRVFDCVGKAAFHRQIFFHQAGNSGCFTGTGRTGAENQPRSIAEGKQVLWKFNRISQTVERRHLFWHFTGAVLNAVNGNRSFHAIKNLVKHNRITGVVAVPWLFYQVKKIVKIFGFQNLQSVRRNVVGDVGNFVRRNVDIREQNFI